MAERTVTTLVCDVCGDLAVATVVLKPNGTRGGSWFKDFCQTDLGNLMNGARRAKGGRRVTPSNAPKGGGNPPEIPEGLIRSQADLLAAIRANPGGHPSEYAATLGIPPRLISARFKSLRNKGLVRAEGATSAARYFPAKGKPRRKARR